LHTWSDPSGSTRLLRAALASRGLWEVDLGADARRETWIRATPFDDRRAALASALDPTNPSADLFGDESLMASPDIVVRPAWPVTEPPQFPGDLVSDLGPKDDIGLGTNFNLWTFQTAFRWQHPSVAVTGRWSHTLEHFLGSTTIDEQAWNAAMDIRIGADGPRAVYRAPWQTPLAPDFAATEADLTELVVSADEDLGWSVHPQPCTVEVLLHHRDTRPVPAGGARVTLLWQATDDPWSLAETDPTEILAYLRGTGDPPPNWMIARQQLTVPLEARLPRAASIDVDLSDVTSEHVLFLAHVESAADDQPRRPPSIRLPQTVTELVRSWPQLAGRQVKIIAREGKPGKNGPDERDRDTPTEGRTERATP